MFKNIIFAFLLFFVIGCGYVNNQTKDEDFDKKVENKIYPVTTRNMNSETPCSKWFYCDYNHIIFADPMPEGVQLRVVYLKNYYNHIFNFNQNICLEIYVPANNYGKTLTVSVKGSTLNYVIQRDYQSIYNISTTINVLPNSIASEYLTMNLNEKNLNISDHSNYITIQINGITTEHYLLSTFDVWK